MNKEEIKNDLAVKSRLKYINDFKFYLGSIISRFFKQYRIVGETNEKGETYWKAQVRSNSLIWKNVVSDDWKERTNPYLSNTSSISFLEKEKAIQILEDWKKKVSPVKPIKIIEYVS